MQFFKYTCIVCAKPRMVSNLVIFLPGFMILWALVNAVFLRGAPPPFSLTWQYEESANSKFSSVDQEISDRAASFSEILCVPGLLQYSFSSLARFELFFSIVWGLICEVAETKKERSLACGSDGWNLAAVLVLAIPLCFFETCPFNVSSGRTKKQQPLYFFSLCVCVTHLYRCKTSINIYL